MQADESFPGTVEQAEDERALLRAVRELVRADREMRRATGARLRMGGNDLRAVRFVMATERSGPPATPRELAAHLGISSASTTALLDRLVGAGHVRRDLHPTDRRAKVVLATPHAYDEVRGELGPVHDRMRAAAAAVPLPARPAVLAFLDELAEIMRADAAR